MLLVTFEGGGINCTLGVECTYTSIHIRESRVVNREFFLCEDFPISAPLAIHGAPAQLATRGGTV